ncbi:MAG: Cof-type HAD-IIB family hydrolase [Acholeplasma sp.]|nr:Cof-type HAD-IIB family hydrolase [Acholeplasma sp.]
MKKIIYSDLDGTLLNYDSKGSHLSKVNADAISKWIKEENYFSLATGRNLRSGNKYFFSDMFDFNLPLVLGNGTLVYDHKKDIIIYQDILNSDFVNECINYAKKNESVKVVFITARNHLVIKNEHNKNMQHSYFTEINETELVYNDIMKVSFLVSLETREKVIKDLKGFNNFYKVNLIPSSATYLEVVNKETSKYNGILKALEYSNIKDYKIYAIGDYLNDISMITKAEIGFAPSNATTEVIESADKVLCHHNDGAVAEMIEYLLNEDHGNENN